MGQKSSTRHKNSKSNQRIFGSDVIATALREMDIPYACLNPGGSYRGLHDSLVNFLGNERPKILVNLHEEHAVAMAHGYAMVTGRPLIAIVHSNVGLMHATMAIFNSWVDRHPMVIIGATGPLDAQVRSHTSIGFTPHRTKAHSYGITSNGMTSRGQRKQL